VFVDSLGLICGEPKLSPKPPGPVALGRVKSTAPGGPPIPICERAREARSRNSPSFAALDAQCRASTQNKPSVVLGRVRSTTASAAGGPSLSICDRARDASQRNSPSAAELEAQCIATQLNDLETVGASIARQTPALSAARNADADAMYRRGFDIATGIFGDVSLGAKGNNAAGPGSTKIRSGLSPAGQRGFDAAMKVHLSRNYRR
jgi:hypothetical protein